jgi:outer membrane protein
MEDEAIARQTLVSAQRRLSQGDGAQNDALQATTAVARAALDLNRTQAAYEKSLAVLGYTVGLTPGVQFAVSDESLEMPVAAERRRELSAWLDNAQRHHPAIVAARTDIEAAKAQVTALRSAGKPTIDLQANYYENGFPQQGLATLRQRSTTVGITITVPLFDGFSNLYKVHEAEADVEAKEATLIDTERLTLTEIVKAYADASAAIDNLQTSQDLLDAALASQASSKRRYEAGAAEIVELLTSQMAFAEAGQERIRSLADWRSARLRLLATSGLLSRCELQID